MALLEDGGVLGTRAFGAGMVHGRQIAPAIRSLLETHSMKAADLDLVACDIGPGSYTGIRVGLAAAKGIAVATGRPIAGVASLDAMAEAARGRARVLCPAIDARWGQIYGALYEDGRRTTDYLAERPEAFAARVPRGALVFGDALEAYGDLFGGAERGPRELWDPRPETVALLGMRLHREGIRHDAASLVPLYLRPTEAEIKFGRK